MKKLTMKDLGRSLCLLLIMGLISACGSTKIFYATFQSDTLGSPPNGNPPEDPTGDSIYYSGIVLYPSQFAVVNNTVLNSKSVKYNNADVNIAYRYVGFYSKEASLPPDKNFSASWKGVIDLDNSGSGLRIWLGNSHFLPIALLEFKNGNIRLQTSSGSNPTFENLGSYVEGANHDVLISVKKASGTYFVSIYQYGDGEDINTGSRPVLNSSALNTQRPTVYMLFNEDKSGSGFYMIDDVAIKAKEP